MDLAVTLLFMPHDDDDDDESVITCGYILINLTFMLSCTPSLERSNVPHVRWDLLWSIKSNFSWIEGLHYIFAISIS